MFRKIEFCFFLFWLNDIWSGYHLNSIIYYFLSLQFYFHNCYFILTFSTLFKQIQFYFQSCHSVWLFVALFWQLTLNVSIFFFLWQLSFNFKSCHSMKWQLPMMNDSCHPNIFLLKFEMLIFLHFNLNKFNTWSIIWLIAWQNSFILSWSRNNSCLIEKNE